MEQTTVTHYMKFDVDTLKNNNKIHNRLRGYLKNGVVQILGSEDEPVFKIMANVGQGGILLFQVLKPFNTFCVKDGPKYNISISFQNQSFGNTYMHSKELFSDSLKTACMSFQKRNESECPEFVRTELAFQDDVTRTSHWTSLTSWPVPVTDLKQTESLAKVLFSIKTCTMLQKWLKEQKVKERQTVKISLNQTLAVILFSVGSSTKTVEFKTVSGNPETSLLFAEKQGDFGVLSKDIVYYVSLETLILALGICRVPAYCLPCLNFHNNDVLEVVGLPFKSSKTICSSLSVLLLKADPPENFDQIGADSVYVDCSEAETFLSTRKSSIPLETISDSDSELETETATQTLKQAEVKPHTLTVKLPTSKFYSQHRLSSSDLEDFDSSLPASKSDHTAEKVFKKSEKRKADNHKKPKAKHPKLTFNPLI
ncbi:DNA polymerase processivity subunit [Vespertilionid gammaherpesvirus 1]|uniref:DNA polymerase processivity subunit n=1 Tax=Vespertilionid gammaherpesvirus 1 TaxID=2560830 RepID=A0A0X9XZU8_9GAMA|nr:DNA polymerase processivity subunit [Myotis gammaherpesvirus 8]AMA67416.1 DNA polymerase processivity subunit [Vespertilionid gammaherpesvirus 1]